MTRNKFLIIMEKIKQSEQPGGSNEDKIMLGQTTKDVDILKV